MNSWQQLTEQFRKRTSREKILAAITLVALTLWLGAVLLLEPAWQQLNKLKQQQADVQEQITVLQNEIPELNAQLAIDINGSYQQQIDNITLQNNELTQQISQSVSYFVSAEQVIPLLRDVLQQAEGIQLKSLSTSAPVAVRLSGQDETDKPLLYRHSTQLVLVGKFEQLQRFLLQLEKLPWSLNWAQLDYSVLEYPTAEMSLRLITVSENENFIKL